MLSALTCLRQLWIQTPRNINPNGDHAAAFMRLYDFEFALHFHRAVHMCRVCLCFISC